MSDGLDIFLSNRLEELFVRFKEWLLALRGDPFGSRLVIVPHPQAKNWLQLQLAQSSDIGIAAGLQILTVDRAIKTLAATYSPSTTGRQPSRLEMSIALNLLLHEQRAWKSSVTRLALADELASLFVRYGLSGAKLTKTWRKGPSDWQQQLWQDLYARHPEWTSESDFVQSIEFSRMVSPPTVAVFGVPYLIPLHHTLLVRLAEVTSVTYFLPSACEHYWSDVLSEREGRRLKKRLSSKATPQAQQQALEGMLQDTNPLLANLGKVGRLMSRQLDDVDVNLQGHYVLPRAIQEIPAYGDLVTEETVFEGQNKRLNLLAALHADLILLRNPASYPPLDVGLSDGSVQVHVAHSLIREVEVLYDVLLGIIHQHNLQGDPITPKDILVMTPDIDAYQASIQATFGGAFSKLPYRIMDASWALQCSFLKAFTNLLDLAGSRWDVATVLQVWEDPHVQERHQISSEELEHIRQSIQKVGISWGKSLAHRNLILQRSHCRRGMSADGFIGTWDHGIGLLLDSLASGDSTIDFGDSDVLGKWLKLFGSLWSDLLPLTDGSKLSLRHWAAYLVCLCDSYLHVTDAKSANDRERLLRQLEELTRASDSFPEDLFDFPSVDFYLRQLLESPKASQQEGSLQSVRFGSVAGLSGEPARVIAFLGLEDGAMPRPKRTQALDLLAVSGLGDTIPSGPEEDRYHFLQGILSARDYLLLSYRGLNPGDGKEQGPALVLGELLTYLDRYYRLEGQVAGKAITRQHPYFAFDAAYFEEASLLKGFVESNYRAALAFAKADKAIPQSFLPELFAEPVITCSEKGSQYLLTIKNLSQVAKDPLGYYLQKTLGLYLHEDALMHTSEPFTLSALDHHSIFADTLEGSLNSALEVARRHGKVPLGLFGETATRQLQDDVHELEIVLKNFGTDPSKLFDVHLSQDCMTPRRVSDKLLHLPPLKLTLPNGAEVTIVGRLPNLSPSGLVCTSKAEAHHKVRAWPLQLLVHALNSILKKTLGFSVPNRTAYLKAGKITSEMSFADSSDLHHFLEYAIQATHRPSPLIAEWVKTFIDKPADGIAKKITEDMGNSDNFHNSYARWLLADHSALLDPEVLQSWQRRAKELFGPVFAKEGV